MSKYQSYKTTSLEWIGEIPNSWEETRLKYVGNLYGGLTGKSGEDFKQDDNPNNKPYIPYTNIFRNTYISKNHVDYVVLQDGENQNKVKKFDLFFLMSSETYQDLGKSCILIDDIDELYLNSFCKGFRVNRIDVNPLFLNYQLLGSIHKEIISIEGRGFTRINLRQDRLNETPIFLPPLQEQLQIVQFLDEKTELIDKLISTKERKITLLKEQRTSLINEVVTKGLNPNVKMKDSGVEWIGEIPEHWVLIKMKHKGDVIIGLSYSPDDVVDESEGTLVMRSSNVQKGKSSFLDNVYVSTSIPEKIKLRVGDILICSRNGSRNLIGKNCLITKNEEGMTFGVFMTVYRSNYYKFMYWLLNSPIFKSQSGLFLTSTINQLTVSTLQNMVLPFVDNVDEQNEIVEYLNSKTKEIDDLVQLEQKKIDLLKEYRQSLISEVVTGKNKVTN
jgi:type I restriction enzyme S subunit